MQGFEDTGQPCESPKGYPAVPDPTVGVVVVQRSKDLNHDVRSRGRARRYQGVFETGIPGVGELLQVSGGPVSLDQSERWQDYRARPSRAG